MVLSIGIGLIRSKAGLGEKKTEPRSLWKTAGSAFAVTWPNPQALIDGTLMLGDFRASLPGGSAPYFIAGFSSASLLWFTGLAVMVHLLGSKINARILSWLNRICGTVILLCGFKLLYRLLRTLLV